MSQLPTSMRRAFFRPKITPPFATGLALWVAFQLGVDLFT